MEFKFTATSPYCDRPLSEAMWESPLSQQDEKKKMQTTVAIREEEPHRFKILPLKQVPVAQRPHYTESPSINFDRPFIGWRADPPSIYQLSHTPSTSAYSFNSLNDTSSLSVKSFPSPTLTPAFLIAFSVSGSILQVCGDGRRRQYKSSFTLLTFSEVCQ